MKAHKSYQGELIDKISALQDDLEKEKQRQYQKELGWRKEKEDMQTKHHNDIQQVNDEKERVRAKLQKDLEQVRYNLQKELEQVRYDLQNQLEQVRTDLTNEREQVRLTLSTQMEQVRKNLTDQMERVRLTFETTLSLFQIYFISFN